MKAISLWQPWASLMQVGAKTCETRGRATHVRETIAICSAKKFDEDVFSKLREPEVQAALHEFAFDGITMAPDLAYGCVLCVVDLFDCRPTNHFMESFPHLKAEEPFGDYTPGRYVWMTRNVRRLKQPVPVRGAQGWFNLPPEVEAKVMEQLK